MHNAKRMIEENFRKITAQDDPIEYNLCGAVKNLIAELENTNAEVARLRQEIENLKRGH